jgi:uncharacterized protein DUF953
MNSLASILMQTATAPELYRKFVDVVITKGGESWILGVFEGSPTGTAYSWCSDCVAASGDLRSFLADYRGPVKVVQFKVGTKDEWEGPEGPHNPFKSKFPFLSDLPTAVLFRGRIDAARLAQPRKDDLAFLVGRVSVYEKQIEDGSWRPPKPRPR